MLQTRRARGLLTLCMISWGMPAALAAQQKVNLQPIMENWDATNLDLTTALAQSISVQAQVSIAGHAAQVWVGGREDGMTHTAVTVHNTADGVPVAGWGKDNIVVVNPKILSPDYNARIKKNCDGLTDGEADMIRNDLIVATLVHESVHAETDNGGPSSRCEEAWEEESNCREAAAYDAETQVLNDLAAGPRYSNSVHAKACMNKIASAREATQTEYQDECEGGQ